MPGFAVGEDVDKLHVVVLLDGVGENDEAGQIMGVETVAVDVLEMADDVWGWRRKKAGLLYSRRPLMMSGSYSAKPGRQLPFTLSLIEPLTFLFFR